MPTTNPVRQAADIAGSPAKLAGQIAERYGLFVTRQKVEHWIRAGRVPPPFAIAVEELTGVPRQNLVPDQWRSIWPDLVSGIASAHGSKKGRA